MKINVEQDAQFVAGLCADATREKLAEVYATALFEACDSLATSFDLVVEEYDSFILQVCDAFPKFEEILYSATVAIEEKQRMIDELCASVTPVFRNFLKTLARRGRLELIRDVRRACALLENKRKGRIAVNITTATPLDETLQKSLSAKFQKLIGGEPELFITIDPDLIGGLIVRVGDVVYDASIAQQLNIVRQDLINRSAHEIQSRRDCFRNSEGN